MRTRGKKQSSFSADKTPGLASLAARKRHGRLRAWSYPLVFGVVAMLVAGSVGVHIHSEYQKALGEWKVRQSSIADYRSRIVSEWLEERLHSAEALASQPLVVASLEAQKPDHPAAHFAGLSTRALAQDLDRVIQIYGYASALVLDRRGQVLARSAGSYPLDAEQLAAYCEVANTATSHIDVWGDAPEKSLVSFCTPVPREDAALPARGTVVVLVRPAETLFPVLLSESVPTRSGETVLVRRECTRIAFITPTRHRASAKLVTRISDGPATFAAHAALEGREEFGEFTDYRGVRVLAATRRIPATGWGLVCKIDRAEAFGDFRRRAWLEALGAAFLLAALASLLVLDRRYGENIATRKEEEKFRALVKATAQIVWTTNAQGEVEDIPEWRAFTGQSPGEVKGWGWKQALHPDDAERVATLWSGAVKNRSLFEAEYRLLRKDGEYRFVSARGVPILEPDGSIREWVGFCADIHERKRAEQALQESEAQFRSLFDNMLNGFAYCRMVYEQSKPSDFIYLAVNPSFEDLTGLRNVVGKKVSEVIPGFREADPELLETYGRVARTGKPAQFELYVASLKMWFWISVYSPRSGHFVAVFDVITDRKRAEAERARLIAAIEQTPEAVIITDVDGSMQYVNPAFTWITGYSRDEALGKNPRILKSDRLNRQFYQDLWDTILAGKVWRGEMVNRRKDQSLYTQEMTITPVRDERGQTTHFIGVGQDVTERRKLEEQLRQAQKMEAIGQLAGGIAHDFNNLLTIITGYSQLLLGRLDPGDSRRGHVEQIRDAGVRAAALTRQLLAFSRRQVLAPQVLNLNTVVANLEKMLQRLIGEDIELVATLDPGLGQARADPSQIEQVILNLAVNSRDAMPQGGKLTIETANVDLDTAFTRHHVTTTPGPYVMLAVSDTGCGMDQETLTHVFEPFFTTKEPGKGTGLGLATVYGIVKQSGGSIWAYSEPDKGATFKIYLPRVMENVKARARPEIPEASFRGSETILVVEDDAAVRTLLRGILRSKGYTVLEASRGDEALRVLENHGRSVDLLLTDVVMPAMTGRELAQHILLRHPETRILYISGYTDDAVIRHGVLEKGAMFLPKPFTPDTLARKVRATLDEPRLAHRESCE